MGPRGLVSSTCRSASGLPQKMGKNAPGSPAEGGKGNILKPPEYSVLHRPVLRGNCWGPSGLEGEVGVKQNYDPGTQPLLKTDQHGPPRTLLPMPRRPITQHLLTAVPSLSLLINYKFNITNVVKAAIQNHESFQRCTELLKVSWQ